MNTATLDIDQIASAAGLRKSRAISGGVYLCKDEDLRAFAEAIATHSRLHRDEAHGAPELSEIAEFAA